MLRGGFPSAEGLNWYPQGIHLIPEAYCHQNDRKARGRKRNLDVRRLPLTEFLLLLQKKFVNIRKHPEACASGHFLYDKGENYELCFASPMSSSTLCLYYRTFSQKVKPIPRKISKNYFFVFCNISRKFYAQTCTLFCKILTNCHSPPRFATKFGKRGSPGPPPESSPQAPRGRAGAILSSRPQNRGRKDRSRSRSSRTPRRRSAQDSCPRRDVR